MKKIKKKIWRHKIKCRICGEVKWSKYKDICESCYGRELKLKKIEFKFATKREEVHFLTGMAVTLLMAITGFPAILFSLPMAITYLAIWSVAWIFLWDKIIENIFRDEMRRVFLRRKV